MKTIRVWRLEHAFTCLGPFSHDGQIPEVIHCGITATAPVMRNLNKIEDVDKLIITHQPKFAFACRESFDKMIRDKRVLRNHGFVGRIYEVVPLYVHPEDNQVIYSESQMVETFIL